MVGIFPQLQLPPGSKLALAGTPNPGVYPGYPNMPAPPYILPNGIPTRQLVTTAPPGGIPEYNNPKSKNLGKKLYA